LLKRKILLRKAFFAVVIATNSLFIGITIE
jgi:hypothetical protein